MIGILRKGIKEHGGYIIKIGQSALFNRVNDSRQIAVYNRLMSRTYGHRNNRMYWAGRYKLMYHTMVRENVKHFSNERCRAEARSVRDNARHGKIDERLPIDYAKYRYQDVWAWD